MTKKNKNRARSIANKLQMIAESIEGLILEEQQILDSLEPRQRILNKREEILEGNIMSMDVAKVSINDAVENLCRVLEY